MSRPLPFLLGLVIVASAALWAQGGATPPAQSPVPPPQQPTFRLGIDSVSVDVSVTDKQGRPVTDLKAEDFEIRESNKVQTVDTFKLITIDDSIDVDPARARPILSFADQEREAANSDNRLFIIFLDDYHVRRGNGMQIRESLAQFVRQLTPRDLVAVLYPLTPVTATTFSRNHDGTAAAVMKFQGRKYEYSPTNKFEEQFALQPPAILEKLRNAVTIDALEAACMYLGTLREGRKSLLFVSEGMSATLPPGVNTSGALGRDVGTAPATGSAAFFASADLILRMQNMFAAAARNNTAIYTIDPRGLAVSEFDLADQVGYENDRQVLQESMDSLRIIADQTDGRAIVNRNEPLPELKRMVRDMSAYYLLGYTSSVAARDGKFHEIQVRVKRKDVDVRARKGYWAYTAEEVERATAPARPAPPAEVTSALEELASVADGSNRRSIGVWMGAARGAGPKAAITIAWEATTRPGADPIDTAEQVTVTATSNAGDVVFRGPVKRDPQAARVGGRVTFDASAGMLRVRVVPENARGQRLEPADLSFDVPDFTGTGARISTPVVFRGRTARDLQLIKAAPTALPAVVRQFSRAERLLLRFDAYGPAGSAPTLSLRLLNGLGDALAALPDPSPTSGSTYEAEISLSPFAPGDYVIEITATSSGDTTKKLLAVRVTG